jgi:hypothetical protein
MAMRTNSRIAKLAGIFTSLLAIIAVGLLVRYYFLHYFTDPLIYCQKVIDGALEQYCMVNRGKTYPNVEGDSRKSFHLLAAYMKGGDEWGRAYGYIPGLTQDDPPDLVLMYLKEKTRRTWNGDHSATIATQPKWMVIGPEFFAANKNGQSLPEGGSLEETQDFKLRLQKTFDFLKANDRPFWTNVVREQTEFLNSIKE